MAYTRQLISRLPFDYETVAFVQDRAVGLTEGEFDECVEVGEGVGDGDLEQVNSMSYQAFGE